jgi:hypothetical protein
MPGGSFKKWVKPVAKEGKSLMHDTYDLAKKRIVSHALPRVHNHDTYLYVRRKGLPQRRSFLSLCKQSTR